MWYGERPRNEFAKRLQEERERPAYKRALRLIDALNAESGPGRVLHGAMQAFIVAQANDVDAAAERHRGGGHD